MSNKRLKILVALITVFAACLITLAGCKIGAQTAQDILREKDLTARVIYYANEGEFNNNRRTRSIFFKDGAPVLNVKQEGYIQAGDPYNVYVRYSGYVLEGWYYAELDDNGYPVFTDRETGERLTRHIPAEGEETEEESGAENVPENGGENSDGTGGEDNDGNRLIAYNTPSGRIVYKGDDDLLAVSSGKRADFSKRIGAHENWYLVANWTEDVMLQFVLVSDADVTIGGTAYHNGEVIHSASFAASNSINISTNLPAASSDSTYLQTYSDEACLTPVTRVAKPADGKNATVYAKYIAGEWNVVREALDVSNMFAGLSGTAKYYILNDIDCSRISVTPNAGNFGCTIEGNGKTLSNLSATYTGISSGTYSLLGNLTSTAKIANLTLRNLSVRLDTISDAVIEGLYMICGNAQNGAQIEGLNIENAEFTFNNAYGRSAASNLCRFGYEQGSLTVLEYLTDNWMFGGLETDAAFSESYGVTVNGYTLKRATSRNETETLVSVAYTENNQEA